ncbi:P-loop containing nucleoside triphosphate hydrolase protein [Auriscalpium vulgare]|uniref:P-loop containing nucleoside triphosphate hydrolase protein n=1 Tax=Auriscalpium vulgare TaxID=40419 RepID=A0ACB8SE59_9AGAM|nr:P-loop containing nucleoside triphosphate hydrolase protein [Auriscalpium vulgare]
MAEPEVAPEALPVSSALAASPQVLIAASLFVALLAIAISLWLRRKSQSRGNTILFVGPPDAGKTAVLSTLVYRQTLPSHTSLQTNTSVLTLLNNKTVTLVDVPGHPRIRDQLLDHLSDAKAVIFVVDASTVSRNGAAVAEHLHKVLHAITSLPPSHTPPALLILAHKSDLLKTGAASAAAVPDQLAINRVRTVLERELEKRRVSQSGAVGIEGLGADGEESSEGAGLECNGPSGGSFKFAEWEGGEVEFLGTSVAVGEKVSAEEKSGGKGISELSQWLEELP